MKKFVTEIFKTFNAECAAAINVHATLSSLRRACAVKEYIEVEATVQLPLRLIYIEEGIAEGKGKMQYSVHALGSEVQEFLLTKAVSK